MRTAPGKDMGYIICPVVIPPDADPETWLSHSSPDDGWKELGDILLALRAHDQRIEDNLGELLKLYMPKPPAAVRTIVAFANANTQRIQYREHVGPPGTVEAAIEKMAKGKSTLKQEFSNLSDPVDPKIVDEAQMAELASDEQGLFHTGDSKEPTAKERPLEHTQIVTAKRHPDGNVEIRRNDVVRNKRSSDGTRGIVNLDKCKTRVRDMINKGTGTRVRRCKRKKDKDPKVLDAPLALLDSMKEYGEVIRLNLLERSGLTSNRVLRDLNLLEGAVMESARHLREDGMAAVLDRHFTLDNLDPKKRAQQADGCTIASLLIMNAAMLHQRIAHGKWLAKISDLETVKASPRIVDRLIREWERITRWDFQPVMVPATEAIYAMVDTGRVAGVEKALRHLATEASRLAETYADMGADHAGALFNRVMGNQASDGAFFTRPVAAMMAARLTLDAAEEAKWQAEYTSGNLETDWTDPDVWRAYKTVDLACGSGTLLAAMLTEMKRRAKNQGANRQKLALLQKTAVEDVLKGLDVNPISLQLAAAQLTAGNRDVQYRRMGLHLMPYGPQGKSGSVAAGTLELLGQKAIVPRPSELDLDDERIRSQTEDQMLHDNAELEDAVEGVQGARIVVMNPPFTNRGSMGEKYPYNVKRRLAARVDGLEQGLVDNHPEFAQFVDKNALEPMFTALADRLLDPANGVVVLIAPTVSLCAPSALAKRKALARRFHIHTILTCHQPGNINLSQQTNINESIIVACRHEGPKPPTRFINLDRFPMDEAEVGEMFSALAQGIGQAVIPHGWGGITEWPANRMEEGDWTAGVFRSRELAEAAYAIVWLPNLVDIELLAGRVYATGQQLRGSFERAAGGREAGAIPILKSKGAKGQYTIEGVPDEYWAPKKRGEPGFDTERAVNGMLDKAGHLLITAGLRTNTARLSAVAVAEPHVGNGWMPVAGFSQTEARAASVCINSTLGRLQLMRTPGKTLDFPSYSAELGASLKLPDLKDERTCAILAACWERTRHTEVPQYRDGECEVRRLWDEAVAEALGWEKSSLEHLSVLLHQEPHVRGLGYGQYAADNE